MAATAFFYHPDFLKHEHGPGHPECPGRLESILAYLEQLGLLKRTLQRCPEVAPRKILLNTHTAKYIDQIEQLSRQGHSVALNPDTAVSPDTFNAACLAVGSVIQAAEMVINGQVDNAFCAVRPPGHHAESDQALGFCYFNSIAIAARHLQSSYNIKRIAIIDWDVHHGNGTQHTFESDPSILFCSVHQFGSGFYPGTGAAAEQGFGAGAGFTLNVPVLAGTTESTYCTIFLEKFKPALDRFQPEFILLSAGFDAHSDDPLGGVKLTENSYGLLSKIVLDIANEHCQGRLVSILEGGYNFNATARSTSTHIQTLLEAS